MEQRPRRLGDIVDDYCPRERRITNHAIVAIVNEEIRQTRCTTCEAEHVYKSAKVPRRRKPDGADDAVEPPGQLVTPRAPETPAPIDASSEPIEEVILQADTSTVDEAAPATAEEQPVEQQPVDEAWHTHRRLIRATLPRTEGEPPPARPIPEFTMHQRQGRGQGRHGQWHGNGNGNGNGHGRPERRHGRGTHGQGHGQDQGNGNGHGQGQGHSHGRPGGRSGRHRGHKRSR